MNLNPYGRYALYLRRSRADLEEEKRGAGETLARHHRMLTDLARRMGIVIGSDAVYREIVSGDTIAERPQVQRMLSDVERGRWDGIFAADVDRLARGDTMDQGLVAQTFLYSHTLIITPYKVYDPDDPSDREFFEMKLFFARREYDQIKRRLQSGRVNSVKEGLYVCSVPLYGYKRIKLPDRKGYSLEPDPDTAPIVRMIFDWYLRGMDGQPVGTVRIANRLNEMGARTNRGMPWRDDRVIRLLKNPTYAGYVQWNRKVQVTTMRDGERVRRRERSDNPVIVRGLHEPLISKEDFDAAQRLLVDHRKSPAPSARARVANPFAGIAKCGICGHAMIRQLNRTNPKWDLIKCSTARCACSGMYLSTLEHAVLDSLRRWVVDFSGDDVRDPQDTRHRAQEDASEALVDSLHRELARLEKQLSSLRDLLEQGIYSPDVYLQRQGELVGRINAANARLKTLATEQPISREDAIRAQLPRVRNVLEVYSSATTAGEKNALLKSVIRRIIYTKTEKTPEGADPLSLTSIDVWPNLPDA